MRVSRYANDTVAVHHGDCLDVLRAIPDASVSVVITDPPYGLANTDPTHVAETLTRWAAGERDYVPTGRGFMGKPWDAFVPPPAVWDECYRVLKPGGHVAAFAGSRTHDLMTLAIRFAGFDIRDSIAWLYGSGFPKSLDVGKGVDRLDAATERRSRALEFTAWMRSTGITSAQVNSATGTNMGGHYLTAAEQPAVATADLFDRLRPLLPEVPECIEGLVHQRTVESANYAAREVTGTRSVPAGHAFAGETYGGDSSSRDANVTAAHTPEAAAWQGWGTALKPAFEPIVLARKPLAGTVAANVLEHGTGAMNIDATRVHGRDSPAGRLRHGGGVAGAGSSFELPDVRPASPAGRWPTNVVMDGDAADALDAEVGNLPSQATRSTAGTGSPVTESHLGSLHAGRAQNREYPGQTGGPSRFFPVFRYQAKAPSSERPKVDGASHPTVKPEALMRWLVRLLTPPGGVVLDPFAGSGTTAAACIAEGAACVTIERDADYLPLIAQRLTRAATREVPPPPPPRPAGHDERQDDLLSLLQVDHEGGHL